MEWYGIVWYGMVWYGMWPNYRGLGADIAMFGRWARGQSGLGRGPSLALGLALGLALKVLAMGLSVAMALGLALGLALGGDG